MLLNTTHGNTRRDAKAQEKRPAWVDDSDAHFEVDIDSKSRLRKLKRTEAETNVDGAEYTRRLQETYAKLQSAHSMFQWANTQQARGDESDAAEASSDEDAIGNLLKSNTSVLGSRTQQLRPGTLDFKKVKNAGNNAHQ